MFLRPKIRINPSNSAKIPKFQKTPQNDPKTPFSAIFKGFIVKTETSLKIILTALGLEYRSTLPD